MSCSGIPLPPPDAKEHHHHHKQHPLHMSFRSSVGSKPSRLPPLDGAPPPAPALAFLPDALRIDLPMKSVAGTSGVGTSGYYADMAGTLGSSWISRLRRPSPQPPPPPPGPQPSRAAQSMATDGVSAGTEGSGVHGGARGTAPLVAPAPPPPPVAAEPVPYLASAYHVQRLCLSPLGIDDSVRRSSAVDGLKGFGPLRFTDVRVDEYPNGIKRIPPPGTPPDRSVPPYPLPLLPLPSHPHQQQPQSPLPPQRPNPVPKPWNLGANDADATGRLNLRPTGFFPLLAKIVRAAEEAKSGPNPMIRATASAVEAKSDHVTRQQRPVLASGEERDQHFSSERPTATPQNSSGPTRTRVFPLHSNTSTGGSTVRLPSDGSTSRPDLLGRQRSSDEWLVGMHTASSSSRSVSDGVSPATADGSGRRSRRIPPFGSFRGHIGDASASAKGCVPAADAADPWRHHNSARPGIAEDGSSKAQILYKDATSPANDGSLPASRSRSRLAPACGSGSEDRFPFWNMGRFWSGGAASETPSRKRPQGSDAVVSPLKCRKLGNQG